MITTFLTELVTQIWVMLALAGPWMLLGMVMAGLAKGLLPDNFVSRHLGGRGLKPIVLAATIGAPLPVCSCGVLPLAAGLKSQGARRGPLASFLVATPETGVDSIAVTYALMDLPMTLLRPLSAVCTALLTGLAVSRTPETRTLTPLVPMGVSQGAAAAPASCCSTGCGCSAPLADAPAARQAGVLGAARRRLRLMGEHLFHEILPSIGPWFLLGSVLAGVVTAVLPDDFLTRQLGQGLPTMLVMLAVSIPLYMCASASTPLAAALALKGLSPGGALVLLLAGPATNLASLAVVSQILGRWGMVAYVAGIAMCALGLGLATDALYGAMGWNTLSWLHGEGEAGPGVVDSACGLILLVGTLASLRWSRGGCHR
ncbi:SO_0444 family Cu/Zn efflux transporter [Megalodesulfovibrio paquesii]